MATGSAVSPRRVLDDWPTLCHRPRWRRGPLDEGHLPTLRSQHPPILRSQVTCPLVQAIGAPHMTMSRLRHERIMACPELRFREVEPCAHSHANRASVASRSGRHG